MKSWPTQQIVSLQTRIVSSSPRAHAAEEHQHVQPPIACPYHVRFYYL